MIFPEVSAGCGTSVEAGQQMLHHYWVMEVANKNRTEPPCTTTSKKCNSVLSLQTEESTKNEHVWGKKDQKMSEDDVMI